MAKKKVQKKTERKDVVVHSRTYGNHTRAARGSLNPATLNDVLKENTKRIAVINPLAREVHNMLKQSAGGFKEGMFWQKMLSKMHKAKDTTPVALLTSIVGLELNGNYPLKRFGNLPMIATSIKNACIIITLRNNFQLHFKGAGDAYCYDVVLLFFTIKGKSITQAIMHSAWFKKDEAIGTIEFDFNMPKKTAFMYCACGCMLEKMERLLVIWQAREWVW